MTNQALPAHSRRILESHMHECQNLGLILDKFAPWGPTRRNTWDLVVHARRRSRDQHPLEITGGEAKGIWLSTTRNQTPQDETPSLFEFPRTDRALTRAKQERWLEHLENTGLVFSMITAARLVVGLGASHVLETALALDRSSGLPMIPGSTVKGLARSYALYEIARLCGINATAAQTIEALRERKEKTSLERLDEALATEINDSDKDRDQFMALSESPPWEAIQRFRETFGTTSTAGGVCFVEAIYGGEDEPLYSADVMTPHFVDYYSTAGSQPPSDDQNPNPISFLTVEAGNEFWFGLTPRLPDNFPKRSYQADNTSLLDNARTWLGTALSTLGAGGKTASGYGFFRSNQE